MKRFGWIALMLLVAVPAFAAAKKITVAELRDMLTTLHTQNKSDADVATALKQVQLSEMLDTPTMNGLGPVLPGPLSTEQVFVLQARSALLPPPASDIPATPALDAAAQQALLGKAATYVSGTWSQLPGLSATRTTRRFQDNIEASAPAMRETPGSDSVDPFHYIRYVTSSDTAITFDKGAEKLPEDKTPWGRNKMIQSMEPVPDLAAMFEEAKDYGNLKWERWELVDGKPAAVFSFEVPKKKSKMAVNVCCFPEVQETNAMSMGPGPSSSGGGSSAGAGTSAANAGTGSGAPSGSIQNNTTWNPYKEKSVGYRGEFFIDPTSGVILRMNTFDEQKASEKVHQLDTRIDYGPVTVGGKALVLPIRTVTIAEVVPNGDTGAGSLSTRTTLFSSEYKDYTAGK